MFCHLILSLKMVPVHIKRAVCFWLYNVILMDYLSKQLINPNYCLPSSFVYTSISFFMFYLYFLSVFSFQF